VFVFVVRFFPNTLCIRDFFHARKIKLIEFVKFIFYYKCRTVKFQMKSCRVLLPKKM
jgi:hypothetical protein